MYRTQSLTRYLLFAIAFLFLSSCATWGGNKYGKSGPSSKVRGDVTRTSPAEKEVKRPEEKQFASINTPARSASMDIVARGKKFLANGNFDRALGLFQEAVIVDSTNGIAYYFLAKTRFNLGQYEESLGILDKAESLLGSTEEWMEAVTLLREQIQTASLSTNHQAVP